MWKLLLSELDVLITGPDIQEVVAAVQDTVETGEIVHFLERGDEGNAWVEKFLTNTSDIGYE
ncbi:UNVERIFIED_CONTAM: hypothetical protein NCL1_16656 [Trichonephila clavipes]